LYPQPVTIIADATFWGRGYGVLVFRSFDLKQNLGWLEISSETKAVYAEMRAILEELGYIIDAVVIDGKPGIKRVFEDVPVQLCQFHQIATINRHLTRRPKLEAGKELRFIALQLTELDEKTLSVLLETWHAKWKIFLREKTFHPDGRHWHYTHRRIRSAYHSLKKNLADLFTYQRHPNLNIPNTTNSLDGSFSHLKDLLRIHRGLKRHRRWKIIQEILAK
jgi:hypothetical protein